MDHEQLLELVERGHSLADGGLKQSGEAWIVARVRVGSHRPGRMAPDKLEDVIFSIAMAGYRRFVAKQVTMRHADIDDIVKNMRILGYGVPRREVDTFL